MNWFHRKMKLSTFADNAMRKSHRIVDSVNTFRAGNNYLVGDEFLYRGASAAAKVAFGKAKRALSNRDVQAAIEHYLAAIEDEHDWWAPHYELGVVFYSLGQIDRAASLFALSIALQPDWPAAYYNLSQCHKDKRNYDEAIRLLFKYIELDPSDPDGYFSIGTLYARSGDADRETDAYEAALKVDKSHVLSHLNLGVNYRLTGRRQEARFHFMRVLEIAPHSVVAANAQRELAML